MRGKSSRWTPADRSLAIALQAYEDDLCPGCGKPHSVSMDAETEGMWEVSKPIRCHACTAIAQQAEGARELDHPHALSYSVTLRESPDA